VNVRKEDGEREVKGLNKKVEKKGRGR